ncbi:MAG TPA: nucleoside phosphorylase [Planctomycetota bacterium]|nr:nucleoside phosphorylase [Planctomycetota bacterium]
MPRRQYHIGCGPGDLAPRILLCGDPGRAEKVAARFAKVRLERRNREYVSITGVYKGRPLSVMGTGIGPDNTEIAVVEIAQLVKDPVLVRIGSSGALQRSIRLGDLVITTGAVRLENTSTYFVPEGYPAVAHPDVVQALAGAAKALKLRHHVGLTASAPGFYGAQSRRAPGFEPRYKDLPGQLARLNVLNFEMEASALLTLSAMRGFRAGVACAVYAQRATGTFADDRLKDRAEAGVIALGLAAMERL